MFTKNFCVQKQQFIYILSAVSLFLFHYLVIQILGSISDCSLSDVAERERIHIMVGSALWCISRVSAQLKCFSTVRQHGVCESNHIKRNFVISRVLFCGGRLLLLLSAFLRCCSSLCSSLSTFECLLLCYFSSGLGSQDGDTLWIQLLGLLADPISQQNK